jgi:hypothetical protein
MRAAVTKRFAGEKMISSAEFVANGFLLPSQGFHEMLGDLFKRKSPWEPRNTSIPRGI